jgi:hypothetical protein
MSGRRSRTEGAAVVHRAARRADERLVLLHRAHARLILFENGLMTLDEAVFGLLDQYCPCSREPRSK